MPRNKRATAATGLACAAIAAFGCSIEINPKSTSDTAAGAVAETASVPVTSVTLDTARAVEHDSLRRIAADTATGAPPAATADELAALVAAGLTVPVAGVRAADLPDTFAERRGERPHDALDIMAPRGTPVLAATDGRLLALHDSERGGLMVYASDPSDRFVLLYGHLDRYAPGLSEGMALRRGQTIGFVGTTGNAAPDAPHLHFAIARVADTRRWWTGTPLDPRPLLVRAGR